MSVQGDNATLGNDLKPREATKSERLSDGRQPRRAAVALSFPRAFQCDRDAALLGLDGWAHRATLAFHRRQSRPPGARRALAKYRLAPRGWRPRRSADFDLSRQLTAKYLHPSIREPSFEDDTAHPRWMSGL